MRKMISQHLVGMKSCLFGKWPDFNPESLGNFQFLIRLAIYLNDPSK